MDLPSDFIVACAPEAWGIRQTMAWFDVDQARRQIDDEANTRWDNLMQEALPYFQHRP